MRDARSGARARAGTGCGTCGPSAGLGALVSSGLGGGSLIYANVMLRRTTRRSPATSDERWPVQRGGPRAALRGGRGDAGRDAVPGRPRAVRLDAEDDRAARRGGALGLDGVPPEPRRELRARGRGAGRAARSRPRTSTARRASRLPAVRRVHRRLQVRREEHPRLHVPRRRAAAPGATIRCCCEATLLGAGDGGGWTRALPPALTAKAATAAALLDPTERPSARSARGRSCSPPARSARTRLLLANRAPAAAQPAPRDGLLANGDLLFFVRGADRRARPLERADDHGVTARVDDRHSPSGRRVLPPGRRRAGRERVAVAGGRGAGGPLAAAPRAASGADRRAAARHARHERRRAAGRGARDDAGVARRCCRCSAWAATSPAGA